MALRSSGGFAVALMACLLAAQDAVAQAQRGAYLVETIMTCGDCHTPRGPHGPRQDAAFSGGLTFDTPAYTVTAPNITPDMKTGIGAWSDAALKQTLRTGIRPDGSKLAPVMPSAFYGVLSDVDMDSIVVYLRRLRPVSHEVPPPVYRVAVSLPVIPGTEVKLQDGGGADPVRHGFYLATIGHCMECHTPRDRAGLDLARLGAGGQPFSGPWGVSVARDITADPDHGLGRWSDADIRRAITQGIARDGSKLKPPMDFAAYARMTNWDLGALVA